MFSSVAVKVKFSTSWFSLSKLRYKKKTNDRNSRHVETIDLWNQKKHQQMKGKSRITINQEAKLRKRCSKSNNEI